MASLTHRGVSINIGTAPYLREATMRVRVTSIEPRPVIDASDVGSAAQRSVATEDLGPAGEAVRALIDRAAHLSPQHRRRLADEERRRAWPISLAPAGGAP